METFLEYITKSTLCLSIIYIVYRYLYYKTTYHKWSRYLLLTAIAFSFYSPFIKFTFDIPEKLNFSGITNILPNKQNSGEAFVALKNLSVKNEQNKYFNFINILSIIYFSGLFRYIYVYGRNLKSIITKLKKNKSQNNYIYHKGDESFTFLQHIFLGTDYQKSSDKEKKYIKQHETIHAKQLHTIDVLLFQITRALFWFNPLMKFYEKTLKEIHEFISDNEAVEESERVDYSKLLLKASRKRTKNSAISYFNNKLIRDRIFLLLKPEKNKVLKKRFIAGLPVLILILFLYSLTLSVVTTEFKAPKNNYSLPVKGNYVVLAKFFQNKTYKDVFKKNKKKYKNITVSHPKVTIQTTEFSDIIAIEKGQVIMIDKIDNWGITQFDIIIKHNDSIKSKYSGLEKILVSEKDTIKYQQVIGKTGDKTFYPHFSLSIYKHGKTVNPTEYIKFK